jgi:hypothetical protein
MSTTMGISKTPILPNEAILWRLGNTGARALRREQSPGEEQRLNSIKNLLTGELHAGSNSIKMRPRLGRADK